MPRAWGEMVVIRSEALGLHHSTLVRIGLPGGRARIRVMAQYVVGNPLQS